MTRIVPADKAPYVDEEIEIGDIWHIDSGLGGSTKLVCVHIDDLVSPEKTYYFCTTGWFYSPNQKIFKYKKSELEKYLYQLEPAAPYKEEEKEADKPFVILNGEGDVWLLVDEEEVEFDKIDLDDCWYKKCPVCGRHLVGQYEPHICERCNIDWNEEIDPNQILIARKVQMRKVRKAQKK